MSWFKNHGARNKFGAKRTVCSAGHPHPSALEASVCEIHLLREKAGEIRGLKWQSTVQLPFNTRWKVDWRYELTATGEPSYSEAKGMEGRDYKLKLRMWREEGPARLEIWKGSAARPRCVEVVIPTKIVHKDYVRTEETV